MNKNEPGEISTLLEEDPQQQSRLHAFSKYLCKKLLAKLLAADQPLSPEVEQFPAAALFADISGFTQLTESLSGQYDQGQAVGAEHLTLMLSDYFDSLIEVVFAHDGDVIKFAGDALLILFPYEDRNIALQRACCCGVSMQVAASKIAEKIANEHDVELNLKIAIGVGEVSGLILGGVFNRWEYAITGDAIVEVGRLGGYADPGDIIVDNQTMKGMGKKSLLGLHLVPKSPGISCLKKVPSWDLQFSANPLMANGEIEDQMRSFIPAAVASRIAAGQTDSLLLGELRRVTVLFINLPQFTAQLPLEQAQVLVSTIQETCYAQRGSIDKLSCDDKGVSVIAGFGIPPMSEEDDALRAVRAAMSMISQLETLGLQVSIGVATGPVYCGTLGSRFRQEYTLMGDVVNTAARLMQKANHHILCDQTTQEKCAKGIEFDSGVKLALKGKQSSVQAYTPKALKNQQNQQFGVIVGRDAEQAKLADLFQQVEQTQQASCLLIEGEPGIGKTTLLRALLIRLASKNNSLLQTSANAVTSTLYGVWQNLLLQVLCLDNSSDPDKTQLHLQRYLDKHQLQQELANSLPLLNHILGLSLQASTLITQMDNEVKAENTKRIILRMLKALTNTTPLVIVIDDAHWMDSASWSILIALQRELNNCFTVLLTRPITQHNANSYQQLSSLASTQQISLSRLDSRQTIAFVKHQLGVTALPENIAQLIIDRAEGHPLFCEELLKDLIDRKIIKVVGEQCICDKNLDLDQDLALPATIEGAITARMDRLSLRQQLALKAASVIGNTFSIAELSYIYPVQEDKDSLPEELHLLSELGLMQQSNNTMQLTYNFTQTTLQRIAYDLMLFSQRKRLHELVAEWIEQHHAQDLEPYYARLAQHWSKAQRYNKAIKYLDLSAQQAINAYANDEVINYLTQAQDFAKKAQLVLAPATSVRWYKMLGQAYLALGKMRESEISSRQALKQLGYPVPESAQGMVVAALGKILRQIQHRYFPASLRALTQKQQSEAGQAAEAVERLFMIYFFGENTPGLLYASFSAMNLAEREGIMTPILAKTYTNCSAALGAIPLIGVADGYVKRAAYVAEQIDDGPTWAWLHLVKSNYCAGLGRWPSVEKHALIALKKAKQLGDQRRYEEAAATYGVTGLLSGRFDTSGDDSSLYHQVYRSGVQRGVLQTQGWGLGLASLALVIQGRVEAAKEAADKFIDLLHRHPDEFDPVNTLEGYSSFALIAILEKDYRQANSWVEKGLKIATSLGRPTQYRVIPACYHLAEAAVRLLSVSEKGDRNRQLKRCKQAIKVVAASNNIFPVSKSRHLLLQGWFEQLNGRQNSAHKSWQRALKQAHIYTMRYDILQCSLTLNHHKIQAPGLLDENEIEKELCTMGITNPKHHQQWDLKIH